MSDSLTLYKLIILYLLKKVNHDGKFLPFYGNTVVFLLEDRTKEILSTLQSQLYKAAGKMLSQPLHPDTFHMTLHDLVNSTEPTADLCQEMAETKKQTESFLALWQAQPQPYPFSSGTSEYNRKEC